jgi:Taurine catabolism dioxygenase TauD, TfdA family
MQLGESDFYTGLTRQPSGQRGRNDMPVHPIVDHPCLWTASSFVDEGDYVLRPDDSVCAGLRRLAEAHAMGCSSAEPAFDSWCATIRHELRDGLGFILVRDLPLDAWGIELARAAAGVIAARLGEPVSQTAAGDRVVDVADTTGKELSPRQFKTSQELRLHTDPASDLMALACIQPAPSGGQSVLVSAPAVHNALLAEAPTLLQTLYRGFHWHRFGEGRREDAPFTEAAVPVFSWTGGRLGCRYVRSPIVAGHRDRGTPLDGDEVAALDAFDRIASDPSMRVSFRLEAGDMVIANNLAVLHARTRFEDAKEPSRRRLLLRFWLDGGPGFWPKDSRIDYFNGGCCGIPQDHSMQPGYDMQALYADRASGGIANLGIPAR